MNWQDAGKFDLAPRTGYATGVSVAGSSCRAAAIRPGLALTLRAGRVAAFGWESIMPTIPPGDDLAPLSGRFGKIPASLVESGALADMPGAATQVLVALAIHANGADQQCWPSRRTIGRLMGLHPNTVTRMIRLLEHSGLIVVEGHSGHPHQYTIQEHPKTLSASAYPKRQRVGGVSASAEGGQAPARRGGKRQRVGGVSASAYPLTEALTEARTATTTDGIVVVAVHGEEAGAQAVSPVGQRLATLGIVGVKQAELAANPKLTPDLIDQVRGGLRTDGVANPAGLMVAVLEARLAGTDNYGAEPPYVSTPESRARLERRQTVQEAQDAAIRNERLGSAARRDECLTGLSDAQVREYLDQVLRGIDERRRSPYVNITVEQIKTPPRTAQAGFLASRVAREHHYHNGTATKGSQ